ncbi:putative heme exporter protein C [Gluconacetobacter diazotrophicus PA1 5]|uniref:Heme exporter protein C n=1 Tax=Gluconacetobacter diazotrophicus (strain ATCC 49037 / DSM 5601 / CCUG 37298 / CIP 103539 / LMG 7603 / PAl5) TaxID=272568 RepID=A9H401_GLUDA|nr:putative heme exporter protein C [Gluconacetobacter diazotrophicus PA1 5]
MNATQSLAARTGGFFHRYANPGRFLRLGARLQPWLTWPALALSITGIVWGLFFSPADWQQGDSVRIMYVHVPAAWLASSGYMALAVCSLLSLVWRHPLADLAAVEIGPVGAAITAVCLATGSLWGKPMWGTWWVWDARLTSVLVLFFLYLGHIALIRAFDEPQRGYRAAAILGLAGAVDLPIIKFSVQWWNTLHQPDSISPDRRAHHVHRHAVAAAGLHNWLHAGLRRHRVARLRAAIMESRVRTALAARRGRPAAREDAGAGLDGAVA